MPEKGDRSSPSAVQAPSRLLAHYHSHSGGTASSGGGGGGGGGKRKLQPPSARMQHSPPSKRQQHQDDMQAVLPLIKVGQLEEFLCCFFDRHQTNSSGILFQCAIIHINSKLRYEYCDQLLYTFLLYYVNWQVSSNSSNDTESKI